MSKELQYMLENLAHQTDFDVDEEKIGSVCIHAHAIFSKRRETITVLQLVLRLMKYTALKIWIFQAGCLILMCQLMFNIYFDYVAINTYTVAGMLVQYSIIIPFVSFPLLYKSVRYRMQEIEMGVHFSYSVQIIVKLAIIGIGDICMILSGIIVGMIRLDMDFSKAVLYGMIPFLFTSSVIIFITTHTSFNNGIALLAFIYATAALFIERLAHAYPEVFEQSFNLVEFIICIILLFSIVLQIKLLVKNNKCAELQLSLQSTIKNNNKIGGRYGIKYSQCNKEISG